ncbi:DUF748 domain-containing protein [Ramlibacter sp. USB13]|uniref:DUF748 domain-containing protein n=1 Tax=Ramlibacter cellulosilyticus TaxID=2764187 RepID=A0A923MQF1_9BURK|nr:DUF748 domain-containing protein [Ramlibacter cellulosilyticus]MBC5782986.1 DUF748 domain-containing protein [Ramlibacter cellulosilyticus]
MGRYLSKMLRSRLLRIAAGLFALYLLAGFFLVDPLARKLLPWAGERMLASRLAAERVEFNPLTLELRVHGLVLAEPDGRLLAGFAQLYADVESAGLARWAWRIRSLQVDRPQVRVEVRRGGTLNWGALAARVRERMGPPSDAMARVLVDHLRMAEGDILYTDADRPGEPFQAAFAPLGLELEGLSTLPEDRGGYLLAAKLAEQGGTLRWKGDVALNPLQSHGELALEGARVDKVARALAGALDAEPAGTLDVALRYRFAMLRTSAKADVASLEVSGARAVVRGFTIAPRGGGDPLLQVGEARVEDASFDLLRREIRVGALKLDGGTLAAARDAHGQVDWRGLWTADARGNGDAPAPGAPWKLAVADIRLAGWKARWTDRTYATPLSAEVEGLALSAAVEGTLDGTASLVVAPLEVALGPVQLRSGGEPVVRMRQGAIKGAQLQLPAGTLRVAEVHLAGASASVERDRQERLNWTEILRKEGVVEQGPAGAPPDLRVALVRLEDLQLRFVDATPATPVTLDLQQGAIELRDVDLDFAHPLPVQARFAVQQGGRFEAKGSVVPAKASGQLDLRVTGFSLKPFAPYVNRFAKLDLQTGSIATAGKLSFAPAASGTALTYAGGFSLDDLSITEEDSGEAFLGWRKLSSGSLRVSLGPDRAHVGELVALQPFGKVIIFEDQSLNLQRIRRDAPVQPAAAAASASAPFPLVVERLRIVDANAEFADLSLTPRFGTRMQELGGVVTGLSTDPSAVAQLELDGKVDEYGSARIRGTLQPFHATAFTDVTLAFRNLEMTRLTPYSGKFAGRRITSGRLSVDLEYKIRQRQLAGTNKFVVNRLRLGEPVESPGAMKLPLDLAIALLEDSNGVIDLDLPVSGSLDDPQFSYGAIVWKAIVNVLTKIVTAPFRALGALLGGNAERFESAGFDPGSSVLLPPEQEKLKLLADALAKRPALTVRLEPGYDPDADRKALQDAAMRREAAAVAGVQLAPGEAPGPVDINHHKVQTWLEDRYAREAGKPAYEQLRASYRGKEAGAVTRVLESSFVERLGRRFGERDAGPPSALHAELLERLAREVAVTDAQLQELAQARARAMQEHVVRLGLDPARIAIGAPRTAAAREKLVATAVALDAARPPAAQPVSQQP